MATDLNKKLLTRLQSRRIPSWRQLRYIGAVFSKSEKRVIGMLAGVMVLSLGVMAVRLWQEHVFPVPARGGEYIEALVGTPNYVNPLYAGANDVDLDLTRLVYSGLARVLPEGEIVPDLAESLEVSEDGKIITAVLRKNALFHDGKPVTAEDVVFTYETVQNPSFKSVYAAAFRGVTIAAPDEHTVTFILNEPYAGFFSALTVGILPAHLWRDVPPQGAALSQFTLKPVGSGPYRFKSFSRDRVGTIHSYTFERFADYYGPPPFIDRVAFRFYPDYDAALEAYRARQVDGLGFVPQTARDRVAARRDVREYQLALPQYTAIFFNSKQQGVLKESAVREALQIAIDREAIIRDSLLGAGELVDSPVLDWLGNASSSVRAPLDVERARSMLDKAGWTLPEGATVRVKTTKDSKGRVTATTTLKLTLVTADREDLRAVGEAVAQAWTGIGVETTLDAVPATRLQKDILRTHSYDALLYGQLLGREPDPFAFWHSSQAVDGGLNLALFANRNADTLLESARKETDPEKHSALLAQFAELIAAERPAIFLYQPLYSYFVATRVKGLNVHDVAIPADRFAGIADWFIKTRKSWH